MTFSTRRDPLSIGLYLLFIFAKLPSAIESNKLNSYTNQVNELLARNVSHMVPPIPQDGPIPVEISFKLDRVISLISDSATLEISGLLRVAWMDERYNWSLSTGPSYIVLPASKIWVPDLGLSTSPDFSLRKTFSGWENVHMQYNGRLVLERTVRLNVACNVDVQYFPKDIQLCSLSFAASFAYLDVLSPKKMESGFPTPLKDVGEEWTLLALKHKVQSEDYYHPNGSLVPVATYHLCLLLYRNHAFYFLTIIIPSLLLAIIVLLPPLVPPVHCNPRLLIPVTTFLSFNIYMLLLERSLPKASEVPILGQVYAVLLGSCTVTEIFQTISVNFYSHAQSRIPRPLAVLYFRILAPICCLHCRRRVVFVNEETSGAPEGAKTTQDPRRTWQELGRINDRFALLVSSILVIFAFTYLFGKCYVPPPVPDDYINATNH